MFHNTFYGTVVSAACCSYPANALVLDSATVSRITYRRSTNSGNQYDSATAQCAHVYQYCAVYPYMIMSLTTLTLCTTDVDDGQPLVQFLRLPGVQDVSHFLGELYIHSPVPGLQQHLHMTTNNINLCICPFTLNHILTNSNAKLLKNQWPIRIQLYDQSLWFTMTFWLYFDFFISNTIQSFCKCQNFIEPFCIVWQYYFESCCWCYF